MTEHTTSTAPAHRSGDLWAGVVVAGVGAVGLVASFDIFQPVGFNSILGPRAFPIAMSSLLLVLGLVLCMRAVVRRESNRPDIGSGGTLLAVGATVVLYLAVFGTLGFLISTAAFLAALFAYLGERRLWIALLAGTALAVVIDLGFTLGLDVALPRGVLGI